MRTLIFTLIFTLFSMPANGQQKFIKYASTIQDLKSLNTADIYRAVHVLGYYSEGDGGGGIFVWNSSDTSATNTGTTFKGKTTGAELTTGRWNRIRKDGTDYNPQWFGVRLGANAFGDSITANSAGYITNIAVTLKLSITNWGVASSQIADVGQMDRIFAVPVDTNSLSLGLFGYNDMRYYGAATGGLNMFSNSLAAAAVWRTIPEANKIRGQSSRVAYTGSWTDQPSPFYAGALGKYTSQNLRTATVTNLIGTTVYVCLLGSSAAGNGYAAVAIDGVSISTNALYGIYTETGNNRTWAPLLLRYDHLTDGAHTVVVTTQTSGSDVHVMWFAANGVAASISPSFFIGDTLRMSSTGYAVGTPYNAGTPAAVSLYNKTIQSVVGDLSRDGLQTVRVRVSEGFDWSAGMLDTDHVHPSAAGNLNIATSFIGPMNLFSTRRSIEPPRDRESISLGSGAAQSGHLRLPSRGEISWRGSDGGGDALLVTGDDYPTPLLEIRNRTFGAGPAGLYFLSGLGRLNDTNVLGAVESVFYQISPLKTGLRFRVNSGDDSFQFMDLNPNGTLSIGYGTNVGAKVAINGELMVGYTNGTVSGNAGISGKVHIGTSAAGNRLTVKETTAATKAFDLGWTNNSAFSLTDETTWATGDLINLSTSANAAVGLRGGVGGQKVGAIIFKRTGTDNDSGIPQVVGVSNGVYYATVSADTNMRAMFPQGSVVGAAGGPTITSGTGVPGTTEPNGSIFQRTDGTGPNLYVRENGAWVAK